ncbi:ferrous iron transport protein A [Bacillus sp. HMF5848]|uniref:FeoA family protein n=1 Tax=Bacillus sp. HMF5848 TaxID=2495421 RepID=UPI000F7A3488|nr:FeoA family protein [Bacillus sp. HMF5848]RSK26443.1 ferrous iron transport protein A [Bacillus sp. HMF5848]
MVLSQLKVGECAVIQDLSQIAPLVKYRLLHLGITEGTVVKVTRKMPFGGPLMLVANGQSISIRQKEAAHIQIEIRAHFQEASCFDMQRAASVNIRG